jgi:photosystem II stability/assembly factor-like uncharacterized protein
MQGHSDRLLIGTRKGLFFVERAGNGGGWRVGKHLFGGEPVTMVLRDPRDGTLWAALRLGHFGCKMHRSTDGGATWEERPAPAYPTPPAGEEVQRDQFGRSWTWKLDMVWALEAGHASQPGVLWCGTIPGGLFRSGDNGDSWEMVRSLWDHPLRKAWLGGGYDAPGIHSVCVHPSDPKRLAVGVSTGGVWFTYDGGASWEARTEGMYNEYMPPAERGRPESQDVHRVVQCPAHPDGMWVQHHNAAFVSVNGGHEWTEVLPPPSKFGFAVAVHPRDPKTAWFVPADKDERRYPLHGKMTVARTRDGGKTFDSLDRGLPGEHAYDLVYRHGLDIDGSGDRLALGSTTGSLWITEDGGDHFQHLSAHLPPIYVVRFA